MSWEDEQELEKLRELRGFLQYRIKQLESRIASRTRKHYPVKRPNGRYTVRSKDLKPFIQNWIDEGKPLVVLADKAMVSDKTIRAIMSAETQWTTDLVADSILTALNQPPYVLNELRELGEVDAPTS